jgi:hypothetical protein
MKIGESLGLSENIIVIPRVCATCGKTKPSVEHAAINPNYHQFESAISDPAGATPVAEGATESAQHSSSSLIPSPPSQETPDDKRTK